MTVTRRDGQNTLGGTLTISRYFVHTEYALGTQTYQVLVCDENDNGQGDWKGFFTLPKGKKAAALDDAVMGVGPKTAACVVDNNLLSSKPKSWNAFKSAMKQIDDVCAGAVYYNTVVKNGDANARNLGYAGAACQYQTVTDTVLMPVEKKDLIEQGQAAFSLTINGGKLLPTEEDTLSVNYDDNGMHVRGGYNANTYEITSRKGTTAYLSATRLLIAYPNRLNILEAAGNLVISDKNRIAGYDNGSTTYIKVETKKGGFFGFGTVYEKSYALKSDGSLSIPVSELIGPINSGKKYYFSVSASRVNSEYYGTAWSGEVRTETAVK